LLRPESLFFLTLIEWNIPTRQVGPVMIRARAGSRQASMQAWIFPASVKAAYRCVLFSNKGMVGCQIAGSRDIAARNIIPAPRQ
jgi:hypothetical protein